VPSRVAAFGGAVILGAGGAVRDRETVAGQPTTAGEGTP
jgi:hypothetical protein